MRRKSIIIPYEGSEIYNMRRSRGYVSIRNPVYGYYHKFFYKEDYVNWILTGKVLYYWRTPVNEILRKSRKKTPL